VSGVFDEHEANGPADFVSVSVLPVSSLIVHVTSPPCRSSFAVNVENDNPLTVTSALHGSLVSACCVMPPPVRIHVTDAVPEPVTSYRSLWGACASLPALRTDAVQATKPEMITRTTASRIHNPVLRRFRGTGEGY
jgi:hypothetical protein